MAITIRARRRQVNKLLSRKEIVLDVFHEGVANVSHKDLRDLVAQKFKADPKNIILYGFKASYGGGRSTGFVLIYDNPHYLLKYEPNYRLRRLCTLCRLCRDPPQAQPKAQV
jgi:small subunit ribosomal protein S24e